MGEGGLHGLLTLFWVLRVGVTPQEHLSSSNTSQGPCTLGTLWGLGIAVTTEYLLPGASPPVGETAVPTANQAVSCQGLERKPKAQDEESASEGGLRPLEGR